MGGRGHLVLGPLVWGHLVLGDSWSSVTAGPGRQLVLGDSWSWATAGPLTAPALYAASMIQGVHAVDCRTSALTVTWHTVGLGVPQSGLLVPSQVTSVIRCSPRHTCSHNLASCMSIDFGSHMRTSTCNTHTHTHTHTHKDPSVNNLSVHCLMLLFSYLQAYHKLAKQYHPDKNPGHEDKVSEQMVWDDAQGGRGGTKGTWEGWPTMIPKIWCDQY